MKHLHTFESFLNEKKPAGAPSWKDSDAPDANGRFRDLGIKDLAAWLIKSRKKDMKMISGSITQQIVFNRKEDPEYVEKMEKVRQEVYKQMGREDLMEDENRISRKPGQPIGSDKHSDLYTDEDPEGTIQGLGFKDPETAKKSIDIIRNIDREHAHKVQATLVMQQRGKVAIERTEDSDKKKNLIEANKIWTEYLEELKKITKERNEK